MNWGMRAIRYIDIFMNSFDGIGKININFKGKKLNSNEKYRIKYCFIKTDIKEDDILEFKASKVEYDNEKNLHNLTFNIPRIYFIPRKMRLSYKL